jgi:hypothetical protein
LHGLTGHDFQIARVARDGIGLQSCFLATLTLIGLPALPNPVRMINIR